MKKLSLSLCLMAIMGCSTSQFEQEIKARQEIIEDNIKEDRVIGDSLPSWTKESGIENGMVFTVGNAEFDANNSPNYILDAAKMNAETKLISDAPTDFRIITQKALKGAGINSSEYYSIQTKLQEVVGLTGVKFSEEKQTCRKIIRYGNLDTNIMRSCWVQAHVSLKDLLKAYRRTLALKYSDEQTNAFSRQIKNEFNKVDYNSLSEQRRRQDEKDNTTFSSTNN